MTDLYATNLGRGNCKAQSSPTPTRAHPIPPECLPLLACIFSVHFRAEPPELTFPKLSLTG